MQRVLENFCLIARKKLDLATFSAAPSDVHDRERQIQTKQYSASLSCLSGAKGQR